MSQLLLLLYVDGILAAGYPVGDGLSLLSELICLGRGWPPRLKSVYLGNRNFFRVLSYLYEWAAVSKGLFIVPAASSNRVSSIWQEETEM